MSTLRLQGKVAIVTGGASGIGEAAVRLFCENGAFVVVADVQDELGQSVVESINNGSSPPSTVDRASYHHCDVRDEKQVEETVSFAVQKYGTLDVMFSNAGIFGPPSGITELDLDSFDKIMATNVRGVAATIKHAVRAMVAKEVRGGSIICTASAAASVGGMGPAAYTTSKHAVVGLVRAACAELGAHGIRVNCVSPFVVATPLVLTALNQEASQIESVFKALSKLKGVVLTAKHVAEAALFLASDDSAYVSGLNLTVDGGFTSTVVDQRAR